MSNAFADIQASTTIVNENVQPVNQNTFDHVSWTNQRRILMFMMLSSWHGHCKSYPVGSSDEYSTSADQPVCYYCALSVDSRMTRSIWPRLLHQYTDWASIQLCAIVGLSLSYHWAIIVLYCAVVDSRMMRSIWPRLLHQWTHWASIQLCAIVGLLLSYHWAIIVLLLTAVWWGVSGQVCCTNGHTELLFCCVLSLGYRGAILCCCWQPYDEEYLAKAVAPIDTLSFYSVVCCRWAIVVLLLCYTVLLLTAVWWGVSGEGGSSNQVPVVSFLSAQAHRRSRQVSQSHFRV